jgi:hypothetical protein
MSRHNMAAIALALAASMNTHARPGERQRGPSNHKCPICGKLFAGRIALKQHTKSRHTRSKR